MNNSTNAIIVLLIVTAGILGAILLASYVASPAYANVSVKQGDYIMGTINFSPTRDLVYIIDLAENKMNVYAVNVQGKSIGIVDSKIDLEKAYGTKSKPDK